MLAGSYSNLLVLFSFLVAVLASYTALDMVGRITHAKPQAARWWLLGGAVAMGVGVWSMHFIGMLAFSLPIQIGYDIPLTLLSLLIAISASAIALWIGSRDTLPINHFVFGALLMGGGIAAMHYTGMAAMKMMPGIVYDVPMVILSLVIAVVAAGASLWIAFRLRSQSRHVRSFRFGASVVMGVAIVAMHYTGMAAAEFPLGSICGASNHGWPAQALAPVIVIVTVMVLITALVTSLLDWLHQVNTTRLSTSLAKATEELSYLVLHDNLTKLPNRILLEDRLKQAIKIADETKGTFTAMFLDLDGFKNVNDTFGHEIGDALLIQAADRVKESIRSSDTSARLGGDEFVILAYISEAADAATIADKLVAAIDEPFLLSGYNIRVSVSIGIAIYPGNGTTPALLIKNADAAMYHAKFLGRNQYCFFEESMSATGAQHQTLLQDLRLALKRRQFVLHYQPKFDAPDGPIAGVEALLRWQHPTYGLIPPGDFIPLAERTGQIIPIGEWVIDEACRQIAEWNTGSDRVLTMAVNISALQFTHVRFIATVEAALAKHALNPGVLTLEVTETTAMRDVEASLRILKNLNDLGVRISIDDFGTGYSSLLYLKRLPASELKIDRGFIRELMLGTEDEAIVSAIVALGKSLNLKIVAEGVETDQQKALLTKLGCHALQGFLLGKPMPAQELGRIMRADPVV